MKLLTLRKLFNQFKYLFVALVLSVSFINFISCDNSGLGGIAAIGGALGVAAVLGGAGGPASAGVVVAAGGEAQKPALLLPFTAEVAALAISPNGETLYAADRFHNTVSVVDIRVGERRTVAVLDAGTGPRSLAVTPDEGKLLLVPNFGTGTQDFNSSSKLNESLFEDGAPGRTVRVIDVVAFEIVEDVPVGRRPLAIVIKSDDSKAYVANFESENVSVIDLTNFTVATVTLSGDKDGSSSREIIPVAIAITGDGSKVLVVSSPINTTENAIVDIIDTQLDQSIASIEVGPSGGPPFNGIAIHPDDTKAYVTNPEDNSFSIIDLGDIDNLPDEAERVSFSNGAGVVPGSLVFSIDGTRAYVAFPPAGNTLCPATDDGELAIIDTQNDTVLQDEIKVGEAAIGLVITDIGEKVYTISGCEDPTTLEGKVSRVDITGDEVTADDIKTIDNLRNRATSVTIGLGSTEVFVALPDAIAVIDTATDTVVNEGIPVRGSGPTNLNIDGVSGDARLFAVHPGIDSVSVTELGASGDTFLGVVPVGSRPASLVIEADQVIVGNAGYSRTPDRLISIFETDVNPTAPIADDVLLPVKQPIDINDDDFGIGRGPVDLKVVPITAVSIVTANFGDFFPNTRRPGDSISLINDFSVANPTVIRNDFEDDVWPIEITIPFESGGNQIIYTIDFLGRRIFPRGIDNNGNFSGSGSKKPANAPASAEILDVDQDKIPNDELYVVNYIPNGQTIIIDKFDLTTNPLSPPNSVEIAIDFDIVTAKATNAGKLKILQNQQVAAILHGGDRSFPCDGDVFCDIGNIVSLVDLVNPADQAFITVGKRPTDIAFSEDETKAFVTNYFDGTVSIIDINNIVFDNSEKPADKVLDVGDGPSGVFVWDSKAYVANSIGNSISVIPIESDIADITQISIETIALN